MKILKLKEKNRNFRLVGYIYIYLYICIYLLSELRCARKLQFCRFIMHFIIATSPRCRLLVVASEVQVEKRGSQRFEHWRAGLRSSGRTPRPEQCSWLFFFSHLLTRFRFVSSVPVKSRALHSFIYKLIRQLDGRTFYMEHAIRIPEKVDKFIHIECHWILQDVFLLLRKRASKQIT